MIDELHELLSILCDRDHTPEEDVRMRAILREDHAALAEYVRWLELDASLSRSFRTSGNLDVSRIVSSQAGPGGVPTIFGQGATAGTSGIPVLGFLGRVTSQLNRPVVWSVLAASLLFAGYFVGISWNMLGRQLASSDDSSHPPTVPSSHRADPVATITASEDAKWSGSPPLSLDGRGAGGEGADIAQNRPLSMQSGLVELKLKQGATLTIQGPADWTIDGDNHATLNRGKLVAKVPPKAVGFTLDTPQGSIVDLGTEFSTVVSENGETSLHVLRGEVELAQNGNSGQPQRVAAGEALKVGKTANGTVAVEKIPFDASQVAVRKQSHSPLERWRAGSQKLQTDPSLEIYHDFEQGGETLSNLGANAMHGKIVSPGRVPWTEGRWRGKGALAFGERFAHVSVPGFTGIRNEGARTFVIWLRLDAIPAKDALLIGKGKFPRRNFAVWLRPGASAAGLSVSLNQADGELRGFGQMDIIEPNRWHMIAVVLKPDAGQVFHNGSAITDIVRFRGPPLDDDSPLAVGHSFEPESPEHLTGAIDELAVFNRVLRAEEIRTFYEGGRMN